MRHGVFALCLIVTSTAMTACKPTPEPDPVEMELMTSLEVHSAIHERGKTTALVFTGGVEARGPHGVLGGHNLMARGIAAETARALGNALVAPIIPVASTGRVGPGEPGTLSLPLDVFQRVVESVADSLIRGGFTNIVLMGDHGTGQDELAGAAAALDAAHRPHGVRVIHALDQYEKARKVFDAYAQRTMTQGFAYGTHAGLYDTSLLIHLQPALGTYVRELYRTVTPNAAPPPGQPEPERRVDNGVSGDPRFATSDLGRKMLEIKVQLAVEEIARKLNEEPVPR